MALGLATGHFPAPAGVALDAEGSTFLVGIRNAPLEILNGARRPLPTRLDDLDGPAQQRDRRQDPLVVDRRRQQPAELGCASAARARVRVVERASQELHQAALVVQVRAHLALLGPAQLGDPVHPLAVRHVRRVGPPVAAAVARDDAVDLEQRQRLLDP